MFEQSAPMRERAVELPDEKKSHLREDFFRRKRRRILSIIPFLFFGLLALLVRLLPEGQLGIPFSVAGPVAYVTLLATIVFRVVDWRCPACHAWLGLEQDPKYCAKCGFKYEDDHV